MAQIVISDIVSLRERYVEECFVILSLLNFRSIEVNIKG